MTQTQNTSSAVMNRREAGASNSPDFFPTPPWAARAVADWLATRHPLESMTCWEPCCGAGHMVYALEPYFRGVLGTDLYDYGWGYPLFDATTKGPIANAPDWVITNPPFNKALPIAARMLPRARGGVALLLRLNWLETQGRWELFGAYPPSDVLVFSERVPMKKNTYDPDGSTATCYAWFVWDRIILREKDHVRLHWLPPGTKARLLRPEDENVREGYRVA